MATVTCRDCNETKPTSEFWPSQLQRKRSLPRCVPCAKTKQNAWTAANRDKARAYGRAWYLRNKEQADAASREWERRNPEKKTARRRALYATGYKMRADLRRRYGLTIEQYESLAHGQDGKCGCCAADVRLYVDHCHDTGRVRGLLCRKCNSGIGFLGDQPDLIVRAVAYLRHGTALESSGRWMPGIGEGLVH